MIDIGKVKNEWNINKEVGISLANGDFDNYSPYVKLGESLIEGHSIVDEALTKLDRLQKKETAMKVDIGTYGILSDTHRCPSCNKRIIDGTYCRYCGQKLDWSDEK